MLSRKKRRAGLSLCRAGQGGGGWHVLLPGRCVADSGNHKAAVAHGGNRSHGKQTLDTVTIYVSSYTFQQIIFFTLKLTVELCFWNVMEITIMEYYLLA